MNTYADIILPLPLAQHFTYKVPAIGMEQLQIGCRVVVPFGSKKYYTGIVLYLHDTPPQYAEVKEIWCLLDEKPIILPQQLNLWIWISNYYLCTIGDVFKAAMPSGLKVESETIVIYNPEAEVNTLLSEREIQLINLLQNKPEQAVTKLEKDSGQKNILPIVNRLISRGILSIKEELQCVYKPRLKSRVRLVEEYNEKRLHILFDFLSRAPKQLDLLMKYVELSGLLSGGKPKEISKQDLLQQAGVSSAVLNGLCEKRILEIYQSEIGRLADSGEQNTAPSHSLSNIQQQAFDAIKANFMQKRVCLLHGVTACGKTEIYIRLIEETLQQGKQVLYMLPEIALTTQITERLMRVFGDKLGVYHSKFPDAERVEIWHKQLSDHPYDIILGVRSSVFLPFQRLGLVIIDEEHENTYKQQDPAPRYHARSAAIMLASMYAAKVLLGSATPSIESWNNAHQGKYGLVELKERYSSVQLPEIIPVDTKDLRRKKRMNGPFSPLLLQYIRDALVNNEQVILFQNRRGFAPMIECRTCGWVPRCKNCDVSLTYHRGLNQLTCHYCGYTYQLPKTCPACGGAELVNRGFGTEKIEEDIKQLFPEARVARMDLDTTRTRNAYERLIHNFEARQTDILIGTQMVSKGLDFDNVSVVGILNADTMLNYPDFRAYERAFQLMAQVAGRAGRKEKRGRVILQTRDVEHPIIYQVITNQYDEMAVEQLTEREAFRYPPYCRLIYVYIKHRKEDVLEQGAILLANQLRSVWGTRVLGPDKPPVARIQTLFIKKIVIKMEPKVSMNYVRDVVYSVHKKILSDERFRSLQVYYDVDPQ